jgi:hypothetical protein
LIAFGGQQDALDAETAIAIAEAKAQLENKRVTRYEKVAALAAKTALVINGVIGNPAYGPDSSTAPWDTSANPSARAALSRSRTSRRRRRHLQHTNALFPQSTQETRVAQKQRAFFFPSGHG